MEENNGIVIDYSSTASRKETVSLTDESTSESTHEVSHETNASVLVKKVNTEKTVNIIVAGRKGVGKSALIRTLLGGLLAKTQERLSPTSQSVLEMYEGKIGDMSLFVYHVGFICNPESTEEDSMLLEKLRQEFNAESKRTIDLVIFCQRMFGRFEEGDMNALKLLGNFLTGKVWKRSIFALTKANLIPITVTEAEDSKNEMEKIRNAMKKEMEKNYFVPHGLSEVFNDIPFIPIGYRTETIDQGKLLCSEDSIRNVVEQCIMRCKFETAPAIASALANQRIHVMVSYSSYVSPGPQAYMIATAVGAAAGAVTGALLGCIQIINGVKRAVLGAIVGAGIGIATCSIEGVGGLNGAVEGKTAAQFLTKRISEDHKREDDI